MNKDGYADITPTQGKQIALVHKILDENPEPHRIDDGWQCWNFEGMEDSKEPIRILERPVRQFPRRYKK